MRVERPSELSRNPPDSVYRCRTSMVTRRRASRLVVPLDKRKRRADSEALPTIVVVTLPKNSSLVGGYFYLIRSRCPPEPAQASSRAAALKPRDTVSPLGEIASPVREPPG